jgi:hypothetical protein
LGRILGITDTSDILSLWSFVLYDKADFMYHRWKKVRLEIVVLDNGRIEDAFGKFVGYHTRI